MTWFKIDDGFYDHPKFLDLPNGAVGLWAKAGAWCGKHLTDGLIPATKVKMLKGTSAQIRDLVEAGLWSQTESEVGAKAYRFHDWNDFQPTRELKLQERADSAERQRRSRARKGQEQAQRENVTRDSHVTGGRDIRVSHEQVSQRPDPTRPDPTPVPNGTGSKPRERGGYSPEFETFWATYPRREAKRQAWNAWGKALNRATVEAITEGARRYAQDSNRDDKYTKHAATWLNADGWEDEPLPSQQSSPTGSSPSWLDIARAASQPADYIDGEVIEFRELG